MLLQIIFSPSNILQEFFLCVDGVEKVGIPLLLLATLAAAFLFTTISCGHHYQIPPNIFSGFH